MIGSLPDVLKQIQSYDEDRRKTRRELTGALAYPTVLVMVSILSIIMMNIFVVPSFRDIFKDREQSLPAATQLVFSISEGMTAYGGQVLIVLLAAIALLIYSLRRSASFRCLFHAWLLRLPMIGAIVGRFESARLFAVLGTLLSQGVPLVQSMDLAASVTGNLFIRQALAKAQSAVHKGERLSAALAVVPGLPRRALSLLLIGEETGQLGVMSTKIGTDLKADLANDAKMLVTLAEPVVILIMGGVIGFIVISMLLGVYSISEF